MNLNQITIASTDVEKSVRYYATLGLNLIVDALPRYARFECPEGESTFSIHHVDKLEHQETTIYFEVENLSEKVSQLKQKGITFISDPEAKSWLWEEAHLYDPDGNKIIIYFAGANRKNPPWRITNSSSK